MVNCFSKEFLKLDRLSLQLNESADRDLITSPDFAFKVLQNYLHITYNKILPFYNTPDKNYILVVLNHFDP